MKLGVIGAGNMASAIINGVLKSGDVCDKIYVSSPIAAEGEKFTDKSVEFVCDNSYVYNNADVLLFAIKPNIYPTELKNAAQIEGIENKLIISIAPGISIAKIKSCFDKPVKVIRTMPNTPAMVLEGMTVMCYEEPVEDRDVEIAKSIFGAIGKTAVLPEKLMNSVVALNGSSPAYVYMFIEAMADAAVQSGIPRDMSYEIAAQSVLGAAKMVLETGIHPGALKDAVCSPGGTTIEAVSVLEKKGFRSAVMQAMDACTKKAESMDK